MQTSSQANVSTQRVGSSGIAFSHCILTMGLIHYLNLYCIYHLCYILANYCRVFAVYRLQNLFTQEDENISYDLVYRFYNLCNIHRDVS